jgi:CBS domain-containing protein
MLPNRQGERSQTGIISDMDVMRFMLADNSTRGLKQICAHEIMSSRLIAIEPHAPVSRAAEVMIRGNISSLLVEDEHLEGILTKADIANYLGATKHRTDSVGHFMTSSPIIVEPSQSLLSIDTMMKSVADTYGRRCIGVLMTGMLNDGVLGMKAIKGSGGITIAQDESSSLVFGMNKATIDVGTVDIVAHISIVADRIVDALQEFR